MPRRREVTSSEAAEKGTYHPPPALGGPPIWKWLLLAALLCIGVIVCGVLGPKLLGGLIDRLYAWWDGSDRSDLLAGLLRPMGWLALVYLGYSLFSYVKMQLLNRVVSRYFTW